ncbi:MAG TPA: D-inositol-3-phosphate glycosyltransferase [Actinobacteria bacterium]|nr:D-inositol-3-phosphate glycosyltransferase [Actinomycetota bacterium]
MNVYVDSLARTLARRGIGVDVFTHRADDDTPPETEVVPGYCVVQVEASGSDRADLVASYAEGVAKWIVDHEVTPDVLHSHYWLSGWAGVLLQDELAVPLAISFHTLGRVKEATRSPGEPRESLVRIAAETEVVARAGCVVASTPAEAADLIEHYQANPERICVSPPGVDHTVFSPGDKAKARRRLKLEPGPLVAFVGRIQPLKGIDVAIEAVAGLDGVRLLVVGGPSGVMGESEMGRLQAMAAALAPGRVVFLPPRPHSDIACVYRAADVVIVPSRSESFGLVAVEAQACGTPVVASHVGGLAYAVEDGQSGYLIAGHDPADYAGALAAILDDPANAVRLAAGAAEHAARFSWDATADRLIELYQGLVE